MPEENNNKLLSGFGLLVVLAILVFGYWWYSNNGQKMPSSNPPPKTNSLPAPTLAATAPTGTLIAGFPSDWIFGTKAQILSSQSYMSSAAGPKPILAATYSTSLTENALAAQVKSYATTHAYSVVKTVTTFDHTLIISLQGSDDYVVVAIKALTKTSSQASVTINKS